MPALDGPWPNPDLISRGLGSKEVQAGGAFTNAQNRATLIVGLSCACFSLAIVMVTLRWFILMKRAFRHRLILFLVASDSMKAIWYFIFAVVAISGRPVASHSGFCQASGFLLLFAMEASDIAIIIIAVHTLLCIFKANNKSGEGGLYPYRHWIYPVWLGPPILAACLAFINGENAYVTAGTFCFLPKRPFWYRLALSWIPRYIIVFLILAMYASIYIYVRIKFRGFKNLRHASSTDSAGLSSTRRTTDATAVDSSISEHPLISAPTEAPKRASRPSAFRSSSYNSTFVTGPRPSAASGPAAPWDSMMFVTQLPLSSSARLGVAQEDFAHDSTPEEGNSPGTMSPNTFPNQSRNHSEAPSNWTGVTAENHATFDLVKKTNEDAGTTDHLRNTRAAIRRQLRFMFIYPLIYILMWVFPFANHVTMYSEHFVLHPLFWLNILSTMSLALQAGVNGVVFSFKEKPWRRVDKESRLSIDFRFWQKPEVEPADVDVEKPVAKPEKVLSSHWWEAEGRRRKDSVWMGTDMLTQIASRKQQQRTDTLDSIVER